MSPFWRVLSLPSQSITHSQRSPRRSISSLWGSVSLGFVLGLGFPAIADPPPNSTATTFLRPSEIPLDQEMVQAQQDNLIVQTPGACSVDGSVITSKTICQTSITIPSLWWLEEQYREANGKLIDTWIAYPDQAGTNRRVDVIVNQQVWSLLDYLERYEFVDWFGSVARDYGFNTRVFNIQGTLLGAYTCSFQDASSASLPSCRLFVDSLGRDGLGRPVELTQ